MGKRSGRVIAMFLAFLMVFSSLFVNIKPVKAAALPSLVNGGFESNFWDDGSWTFEYDWEKVELTHFNYSNDQWMTGDEGDHAFKYWVKDTGESRSFRVKQTLETLPAGSYLLEMKR
jgi:arabinogalactan endo-1,4-beta-galactosidase